MAKLTIDNIPLEANEGEYILEVARKNGIFIPAICYLSKCSPTVACKLCMVEVEGKRTYACNAKIKDGMQIITNTPEIRKERYAIMQSYAINHPLECGVCDKSGECELQDFVHLLGVDKQEFCIPDSPKAMDSWAQVKYDPSLCIMCERCVTTCKDNLGEANLKAIKQDYLPSPNASIWKEKMPKDAFSVWNRKQKALIGFVGENPCFDCSECASVCPVGALGIQSFQYSTNAWELEKISSTCNLCPSGCKIVYERKKDIYGKYKIYRVSNDFNFNPICSAGRFAYDIYADLSANDLQKAAFALMNADYIEFGGNITNNEAMFLQALKEKFGKKLINPTARKYQLLLDLAFEYGMRLSKMSDMRNFKAIFSIGVSLNYDNPGIRFKINNTLKMQKGTFFIYSHSLEDTFMAKLSKNYLTLTYNPYTEIAPFIALLAIMDSSSKILEGLECVNIKYKTTKEVKIEVKEIIKDENGQDKEVVKEQVEKQEIIENRQYFALLESSGIDYETYLKLESSLRGKIPLIIIGGEIYYSKNSYAIIEILSYLQGLGKIEVLLIPPQANSNGIYLNMEVDCQSECHGKRSVGFRAKGDFVIDSKDADYVIPYFNALDDSVVNLDGRLLPLNNALEVQGNYLEDFSKALGMEFRIERLELSNDYHNSGRDDRGRLLELQTKHYQIKNPPNRVQNLNLSIIMQNPKQSPNAYLRDIGAHFYPYTKYSHNLQTKYGIYVSQDRFEQLRNEFDLNEGDEICVSCGQKMIYSAIYIDRGMKGDYFAISPQIDGAIDCFDDSLFAVIQVSHKCMESCQKFDEMEEKVAQ